MEHKSMYVNGVDVSGCDFICLEDDYCSYSGITRAYKGECGCSGGEMCKDNPKCFYKITLKRLSRKTQEYEKLKDRKAKTSREFARACTLYNRCRKTLLKIKDLCSEQNLKYDTTACEILDIINEYNTKEVL